MLALRLGLEEGEDEAIKVGSWLFVTLGFPDGSTLGTSVGFKLTFKVGNAEGDPEASELGPELETTVGS